MAFHVNAEPAELVLDPLRDRRALAWRVVARDANEVTEVRDEITLAPVQPCSEGFIDSWSDSTADAPIFQVSGCLSTRCMDRATSDFSPMPHLYCDCGVR